MREILHFSEIDREKLEAVKELIDCIAEEPGSSSDELEQLSCITGKIHEPSEYAEYWGWADLDTLAETALLPVPPYVRDLTKQEIKEMVSMIKECLISGEDGKTEYYKELLHKSLPLANVMSYILSGNDAGRIAEDMMEAASKSVIIL
uniref:hypothetical protein n=1 Tax=Agathobacter sp. TaxID=2021311 RepID=UPI004055FEB3